MNIFRLVSIVIMSILSLTLLCPKDKITFIIANFTLANAPDTFFSPPPPITYQRFDSGVRPFAVAGTGTYTKQLQKLLMRRRKNKKRTHYS